MRCFQEGVDYYKTFGLEFGASDEEIKKRHKVLALQCVLALVRVRVGLSDLVCPTARARARMQDPPPHVMLLPRFLSLAAL